MTDTDVFSGVSLPTIHTFPKSPHFSICRGRGLDDLPDPPAPQLPSLHQQWHLSLSVALQHWCNYDMDQILHFLPIVKQMIELEGKLHFPFLLTFFFSFKELPIVLESSESLEYKTYKFWLPRIYSLYTHCSTILIHNHLIRATLGFHLDDRDRLSLGLPAPVASQWPTIHPTVNMVLKKSNMFKANRTRRIK